MEYLDDLTLAGSIGQLGTDGHVTELGIEHLFLGVGEAVLLFDGLVTGEDIEEEQSDDQTDQRVLLPDSLATQHFSVQPGLYGMGVGQLKFKV